MKTNAKILVVRRDLAGAADLEGRLEKLGHAVCATVSCGKQAIEKAGELGPELVLVDLGLEGEVNGIEAAGEVRSRFDVPVIYLVDEAGEKLLQEAQESHPFGYVVPPFNERQLELNVRNALAMHEREKECREKVTRLERSVREQQDRAKLMESIFSNLSDGMVVTDTQGNFLFVNAAAESIVGMGPTDGPADEWSETYGTFYPDGKTLFPSGELPLMRAMRGEVVNDVELFMRNPARPQGLYISVDARPFHNDSGELRGGVIVFRHISKLKKTEEELREAVHLLRHQTELMEIAFDSISDGVIAIDQDGKYLIFNTAAKRIVGMQVPDAELSERSEIYGIFSPDGEDYYPSRDLPLTRATQGHSTDNVQLLIRNPERPEGVRINVDGRPLSDGSGMIIGGVIVVRDVTDSIETETRLKEAAKSLEDQTRFMESVFNSISDGVVVADRSGEFQFVNHSAERMIGVGMKGTRPDQWSEKFGLFFPDGVTPIPTHELPLTRAIQGESSDDVEIFVRNPAVPDGIFMSVNGRPLQDNSWGEGGVVVLHDVTERMRAEAALTDAFAQGRLEIVDTILHNIGNAINSVVTGVVTIHRQLSRNHLVRRFSAVAEALEAHQDDWVPYLQTDPQGRKVIPFILALAKDFSKQNGELIDIISRVESRVEHIIDIIQTQKSFENASVVSKEVNLLKLITDSVKLVEDGFRKRNIDVRIDCEKAPKMIRTQESKFHQMLVNLVKNAMEAIDELGRSGGLEVEPRIEIRSYTDKDTLVLDVTDNGIGIMDKHTRIIFRAGYTTKKTGTGLGLHSIANFVIGSGGQIYPLSAGVGEGTTMRVRMRLSSLGL